jgi:O-antigen/teichoic acid export membrane protein
MTGNERETVKGVGISTVINVVLNIALIPRYGSVGAAVATAASIVIWNLLLFRAVWVRLGIRSTAI